MYLCALVGPGCLRIDILGSYLRLAQQIPVGVFWCRHEGITQISAKSKDTVREICWSMSSTTHVWHRGRHEHLASDHEAFLRNRIRWCRYLITEYERSFMLYKRCSEPTIFAESVWVATLAYDAQVVTATHTAYGIW